MPARRRNSTPRRMPGRRETQLVGVRLPLWSPPDEAQRPETCYVCGGESGLIHDGDLAVCIGCLHTGADDRLEAERRRADLIEEKAKKVAKFKPRVRPDKVMMWARDRELA